VKYSLSRGAFYVPKVLVVQRICSKEFSWSDQTPARFTILEAYFFFVVFALGKTGSFDKVTMDHIS